MIYAESATSFGNRIGALGVVVCYGAAACVLRGPLEIDLGLRRRRDVVRYVLVSATAATAATIIGVACLIADHGITWSEYKASALGWFLGDAIGLLSIAPFLLVHVLPYIRNCLLPRSIPLYPGRAPSPQKKPNLAALAETCAQIPTIMTVLRMMFGSEDARCSYFI